MFRSACSRAIALLVAIGAIMFGDSCSSFATTYATWIMVWYGHDQGWWQPSNADASRMHVNGQWTTLDWADERQFGAHLDAIRKAGVTVVIADLTNGWNWLDARSQRIQALCAERGMKFCVAENSTGDTARFESHAKDIWEKFAGPEAPYHETYFHYRGKPLIVCYSVRDWYLSYLKMDTPYRNRFSLVWASGEDSCINKWGWQLEPWVGSVPSSDSMFVTSAVRWNPADGTMWRKSLAWLDYNFALAAKAGPRYVIIGSYDDPTERNTWAICDTSACEPGRQMRDRTGALNPWAYYERVCQWTRGRPEMVPGGILRDGAYRLVNKASGRDLAAEKAKEGAPGARMAGSPPLKAPLGLFWFYHLGRNRYRAIVLSSGLALEASGGTVIQNWDSTSPSQHWILKRTRDGLFLIENQATGKCLSLEDEYAVLADRGTESHKLWTIKAVLPL